MQRGFSDAVLAALLASGVAFAQSGQSPSGQSLADIARANREKQAAQDAAGVRPKVITNQDLPLDSGEIPESDDSHPMTMVSGHSRAFDESSYEARSRRRDFADQNHGAQWRERIQMQESRVAELQARVDQLSGSIRGYNGGVQYERPYNRNQARQMERLTQMQQMLDQQRRQLDMMQEAARRAGMHTTVYDP